VGFVLLAGLSLLAALAALGVVTRARLRGRAEALVAATLLWNGIVILPIYALGLVGHLTARSLAIASPIVSLATLGLATLGRGFPAVLRDAARTGWGVLRLPIDALTLAWRARSLIFVGVAFAALLLPYLAVSAYLAQPLPHWDPLWYHDTMVGFTIQNHGFAMVDLPDTLQKVNGYVRLGEMTQLWLVIFADRRLADITNLLFAPAIIGAVYVMARRYTSQLLAVGWGVAVVLTPTCAGLLHSTYVDPQYGALLLGSVVFATMDPPRLRYGWLASLGLALTIGSKGLALVPVPVAGLLGAGVILHAHWRQRRGAAIATVLGGLALIVAMAATTYLRNYWAFHNPIWPDLRVDIPALGIHWPGLGPWSAESANQTGSKVDVNEAYAQLFDHLFALPWSVKGMFFDQAIEYGIGIIWIAIPLGAVAFVACLIVTIRAHLAPPLGSPAARTPILIALVLAAVVKGSPALWGPRYHIAGVGFLVTLVAWLTRRSGARDRLGESAVSVVLVTSLMMFWWTPAPRWWYSPEQLAELARLPAIEREVTRELGAPTPRAVGLAREQELSSGTLMVFDDRYSGFPSLFWNNTFSNRVLYLKSGPDFLARAARAGATWVFLNDRELHLMVAARAPGSGWQEVGILNAINGGSAFRRIPVVPPVVKEDKPAPTNASPKPAPPPPPRETKKTPNTPKPAKPAKPLL
jgi:hypothetical protein